MTEARTGPTESEALTQGIRVGLARLRSIHPEQRGKATRIADALRPMRSEIVALMRAGHSKTAVARELATALSGDGEEISLVTIRKAFKIVGIEPSNSQKRRAHVSAPVRAIV